MEKIYAKVLLYAFPVLDKVITHIDKLVEKKALDSINDFSPCESQCDKLLELTDNKETVMVLKSDMEKVLEKLNEREKGYLDYKYFHLNDKAEYSYIDTKSRQYYRAQETVLKKFSALMERAGYDERYFKEEIFRIPFFSDSLIRVRKKEEKVEKARSSALALSMYKRMNTVNKRRQPLENVSENYS